MNKFIKRFILFFIFGSIYFLIETIYKQYTTHWAMFFVGGAAGLLIGEINNYFPWDLSFWIQCALGTLIVIFLEASSGYLLNIKLQLHIWDYSNLRFTFFHQQCSLLFSCFWYILAAICIFLDDWLRWKLFHEEKPRYNFSI